MRQWQHFFHSTVGFFMLQNQLCVPQLWPSLSCHEQLLYIHRVSKSPVSNEDIHWEWKCENCVERTVVKDKCFIFDSLEPKWQSLLSWKNNEDGILPRSRSSRRGGELQCLGRKCYHEKLLCRPYSPWASHKVHVGVLYVEVPHYLGGSAQKHMPYSLGP